MCVRWGLAMRCFRFLAGISCAGSTGNLALILSSLSVCALAMGQDSALAPQDQSEQPAPVLSITTHEVLLDVVVTDAGRAVTGLKASDFTVLEDGKPQVIASLQEHSPMSAARTAGAGSAPSLPQNTFTNYTPV